MIIKKTIFANFLLVYMKLSLTFGIALWIMSLCYDKEYRMISVLPFMYIMANLVYNYHLSINNKFTKGYLHTVIQVVLFIRYIITPLSIATTGIFYSESANTSIESVNFAVILMAFELISIYMSLYFAQVYYSRQNNNIYQENLNGLNNSLVLVVFSLLAVSIVIMVEPNLLIPENFLLLPTEYLKLQLDVSYDGFYSTLAQLVKPVIFILLFSLVKKRYDKSNSIMYIWISFILVILFIGLYTGTKRWEIVFAGIIGLYLLKKSYREIPKVFVAGVILVIFIGFISASIYKFSWVVQSSANPIKDVIVEMLAMFQSYFSGPITVANSIEMQTIYGNNINLFTLINDFTGSIPILSNYVDQTNRINAYFNMYHNIPNNAYIIPMLGIGYSYFPIFPSIFTVICQWFLIKLDFNLQKSSSIEYRYLYLYFGLYLAMSLGFNTQIIFSKLLIPFLPLLLLFKMNEMIYLKKATNKSQNNFNI